MHDASMSTSVPGAFVAGELTGIGGAEVAELEGVIAGHAAATYLGRPGTLAGAAEERSARARLARAAAFTRWLEATYSVRDGWTAWPQPRTILCRCEDVTWGAAMRAVADGATSVRAVRNVTRCGMGYCQGRTCGPALALAIAARTGRSLATVGDFHSRSVAWPVPLGEVAREVSVPGPA
jgi:hypothetical protein